MSWDASFEAESFAWAPRPAELAVAVPTVRDTASLVGVAQDVPAYSLAASSALGSDSRTKLYAGFASIPVEKRWIAGAITALRKG